MLLTLPRVFVPTHNTSGLNGHGSPPWGHGRWDAIDIFNKGGTPVCCEMAVKVVRLSGHPPTTTTKPGGPYGWSVYLRTYGEKFGGWYYGTHFGKRSPLLEVGRVIPAHTIIGWVADYTKASHGVTPSHIHWAFHKGIWVP